MSHAPKYPTPGAIRRLIRQALSILHDPNAVVELRILRAPGAGTVSGYFDDHAALVRAAARWDGRAPGVYLTAHGIASGLLARSANRCAEHAQQTTADADVEFYRWLLIDLDPRRAASTSSTEAEHRAALTLAKSLAKWLVREMQCPRDSILIASSGNGAHVLVRVDQPADAPTRALMARCLAALDLRWSTDLVAVDTTTSNPSRIWRAYGTLACKGDSTSERPHRRSRLLHAPEQVEIAPRRLLERIAALVPAADPLPALYDKGEVIDLAKWLSDKGIGIARSRPWQKGVLHVLDGCPMDDTHPRDQAAYAIQFSGGGIGAGCHHARCAWGWRELLERFEPDRRAERRARSPKNQAQTLLECVLTDDVDLFATPAGEAYATVRIGDHFETWPVRSRVLGLHVRRSFYEKTGRAPNARALADARDLIEANALFSNTVRDVYVRDAQPDDDHIYLDLSERAWNVVEITATGWHVVAEVPVRFRRSRGMLPLPLPRNVAGPDALAAFRKLINIDNNDWPLLLAWLTAVLRGRGPYPVLALHGEQGAAKSTLSRMLRALCDPNQAAIRAAPRDTRDLAIAAANGWIVALDNLSYVSGWLSDALCRLSTGGGFATRELYSDAEEVIFDAQRPVLINGIEELATRSDLLDRSIVVCLPALSDAERRPESELWREFNDIRPELLGTLLRGVVRALRGHATVSLDRLPRMADFARWVSAAEPALKLEPGSILRAYDRARNQAVAIALDASPIGPAVLALARKGEIRGTATELLRKLGEAADEATRRQREWPSTARALSGLLRRLAPDLRAAGFDMAFERDSGRGRSRIICITPSEPSDLIDAVDLLDGADGADGELAAMCPADDDDGDDES